MIVTTAGRTNDIMENKAKEVAIQLDSKFITRNKLSTSKMHEKYQDDLFVVGKERFEIFPLSGEEPIFFHPNSAMFRVKRLQKGESDPFVDVTGIEEGSRLLDCTLGLASESIIASFSVGDVGKVVGIEGNRYLAYIVKHGLQEWTTSNNEIDRAMRRVEVINANFESLLPTIADNSYDVVYFDPMFENAIETSIGIKGLRNFAIHNSISTEAIQHAKRIAKQRVVLKDHYKSARFEQHGFTVTKRPSAKFHYGYIEC